MALAAPQKVILALLRMASIRANWMADNSSFDCDARRFLLIMFVKEGTAVAVKTPRTAIAVIISISVKPALRFIWCDLLFIAMAMLGVGHCPICDECHTSAPGAGAR